MLKAISGVARSYQRWIQTSALNQRLREVVQGHSPPLYQGRQVKFFYATQTAIRPPTFTLFVNAPKGIDSSYQRYMVHQLRLVLELRGSPIRLVLRGRREEKRSKRR